MGTTIFTVMSRLAAQHGAINLSQGFPDFSAPQALFDLGFVDVFRCFEQPQQAFSWWDYRAAAFRRNRSLRIDLILASPALAATSTGSGIDAGPRGREQPSDHAPVIARID